ncbi:ATP-dependent DNA helicase PIF1-like [Paramuricea clavata]|uniref:ATP-dependent DNA helicase PIF1-like n=1 Tax=Paramuricea clavata TaxID=317549 RepID=A0A7D9DEQ7_PARCT|nr:ATP-dependent DNA helicase PIF1-like [Paramuricea clavata]
MSDQRRTQMRLSLAELKLIIIDEISMVSNMGLLHIHQRLKEIFVTPNNDDIRCIQSRTITAGDENYPSDALHIFTKNAPVDEYNIDRLQQIQLPQYVLEALDQFPPHVRKQDIDKVLSKGRSETGGLHTKILIKENARVMLTTNVDISDRLINGQLGTVIKVSVDNVSNKPSTIFVKFDDSNAGVSAVRNSSSSFARENNLVPIKPVLARIKVRPGKPSSPEMQRLQFPVTLAWACTVHKVQGLTVDNIVVSFDLKKQWYFNYGQVYVALSRATSLNDLHILGTLENKATGRDEISARLLKECSNEIAPSLTALFNKSLTLGKVPQEWKEANGVPVPKKGDVHEVSNYRPISLLSLVSKLLEQVVHLHVSEFVESSLSNLQHGFRKRRSCVTQLLRVFHDVGKALDSGKEADMVYLDFSKAFDSVSHRNLLLKLEQHGISGSLLNWFSDYLSERRQRVVVDGVSSSFLNVTSGVPQGSVLGPLLFLIYANDLPKAANHGTVPMFADDSKCYRQITQPRDRDLLQDDLNSLHQWSKTWDLNFNAKKCPPSWIIFVQHCISKPLSKPNDLSSSLIGEQLHHRKFVSSLLIGATHLLARWHSSAPQIQQTLKNFNVVKLS